MGFQLVFVIIIQMVTGGNIHNSVSPALELFHQKHLEKLINIFAVSNLESCNGVFIRSQYTTVFDSILSKLLQNQEESNVASGSYTLSISQINGTILSLGTKKDYNRLLKGKNCAFGLIYKLKFETKIEFSFLNEIGCKETPLLKKDEDYFFFLTTEQNVSKHLVKSKKLQAIIKYKVLVLVLPQKLEIYKDGVYLTTTNFKSDLLFPKISHNFQGETLKISVPNYGSAMEMKLDKDQHLQDTRGLYVLWMIEIEKKFNFSFTYFTSSNGTSGIQLENGKWSGGVGDVVNGLAHMSLDISHIYSRQGFVEWASPFHYRGLVFVVHKARYHFPKDILLRPFTPTMWSMFIPCVMASAFCFKVNSLIGFRIRNAVKVSSAGSSNKKKFEGDDDERWSNNQRIAGYITASFLGQPWHLPNRILNNFSVRILITFWLFFAWVTATAYQAKLTSLMGFPIWSFVPTCFEQLLSSDFEVGINALGKGESAYQAFISEGVDVYQGLFAKSAVHPNATECVLKAVAENFACISGEGVVAYAIARSVSFKNGESPLQFSDSKANFVEGGVIYQKRWIYRHQFDQTIRNAMSMGLVAKWWEWHMDSVRADKRKLDKEQEKHLMSDENSDNGDGLKIDKLVSSLLCCSSLLLVGLIIFCVEIGTTCLHWSVSTSVGE